MRTTLTIDDDVLTHARQLAESSGQPIGAVISALARRSLSERAPARIRAGIRLLPPSGDDQPVTLEQVNDLRDDAP